VQRAQQHDAPAALRTRRPQDTARPLNIDLLKVRSAKVGTHSRSAVEHDVDIPDGAGHCGRIENIAADDLDPVLREPTRLTVVSHERTHRFSARNQLLDEMAANKSRGPRN
jgi:hypothetical protein